MWCLIDERRDSPSWPSLPSPAPARGWTSGFVLTFFSQPTDPKHSSLVFFAHSSRAPGGGLSPHPLVSVRVSPSHLPPTPNGRPGRRLCGGQHLQIRHHLPRRSPSRPSPGRPDPVPPSSPILVKIYDHNKNGGVDRSEFGALHTFVDTLVTAATAQRVDLDTATSLLKAQDIAVDATPLQASFDAFDNDGDGTLAASELVGLACFLSAADAVFHAFTGAESGDRRTIELTRDQFIYAAASCR